MVERKKEFIPELDERGYMLHLVDLKKSYQITLSRIQAKIKEVESLKSQFPELATAYDEDLLQLRGVVTDINYCINWLHTGRQPRSKRGIDRRSIYQRTVLVDPSLIERYVKPINSRSASTLTEDEKDRLRDALEVLSPREREVFILAKGEGFPHEQIADMLNIHKGTVDQLVSRAHKKMSESWQGTLF